MIYYTRQGDTFDQIALNIYGTEYAVPQIYMLNPDKLQIYQFGAGVMLILPDEIKEVYSSTLPAWRRETDD